MYGSKNTSEAVQAVAIAKRIPSGSIVLADSGYGIFSVVHAMIGQGHDVLFRLTKGRFKALHRRAEVIEQTDAGKRYRLNWTPSAKDRKTNPELPVESEVSVELHAVEIGEDEPLYLVTGMPISSEQAGELYSHRYDVEHDIRDLKVTLGIENIRAQSDEMVRKEVLCSMVAYNLVVQFRRVAAKRAKLPPRRLSFTGVWNTLEAWCLSGGSFDPAAWKDRYESAVKMAMRAKLPNRPGRSAPRRAHPKRPKSTKFMKQQTKNKSKPPPEETK